LVLKSPTSFSCKTLWTSLKKIEWSAKAKGLTTQCDRKEKLNSGVQNPLKKTGRNLKSQMSRGKKKKIFYGNLRL